MDNLKEYDRTSEKSILDFAVKLVGKSFEDIIVSRVPGSRADVLAAYGNKARKGGLGNLLEEIYFGYKANSTQGADFTETGIELKATCYEITQKGEYRAGERLVLTMISYDKPVESDFFKSHAWEKMRKILLIHYHRNKLLNDVLLYKIGFVTMFSPPKEDLIIIQADYNYIITKIKEGRAHELSEADTMYLGACTKGATAEKSTVPQLYGTHIPARKRAFCFKVSYMTYVLNRYVISNGEECESILHGEFEGSFENQIHKRLNAYVGLSIDELCARYNISSGAKNLGAMLAYRMLGIKSNSAEEFVKANIVIKTIRIENTGKIKENMSFPIIQFTELANEEWEDSTFGNYLRETKFLFVVFRRNQNGEYIFRGGQFWNIPYVDLEIDVRSVWEKTKGLVNCGLKIWMENGKYRSNLPKQSENRVSHVRPHAKDSSDTCLLPDGRLFPKQCFWLNNSYVLSQLRDDLKS